MRSYGFDHYGGPEVTRFLDVPEPSEWPGTVPIELRASGVNPADIKVRDGARQGQVPVTFPMAMGREAAGLVISDASGAFSPGDAVFGSAAAGHGTVAEHRGRRGRRHPAGGGRPADASGGDPERGRAGPGVGTGRLRHHPAA